MALMQFNIDVGEKTQPIHIKESAGVDELFKKVSADCANGVNPEDIRLVFGDVQLEYKKSKRFRDYDLVHMSTLVLLVRLHCTRKIDWGWFKVWRLFRTAQAEIASSPSPMVCRPSSSAMLCRPEAGTIRLSTQTHGAVNPNLRCFVQLEKIPTWTEFYENDKAELIQCIQAKGEIWKQEIEVECKFDPEINSKVSLFEGDITSLQIDGIVSSDCCTLKATGGVSLRICTVAGQEFKSAINKLNGCHIGEAKTTKGFNLPAKHVVHTVGPKEENPLLLESCYRNCLEETKTLTMRSLAFSCIATGAFGYPRDKAVLVALKTVRVWLEEQRHKKQLDGIERIIFCLFTPEDVSLYRTWMQVFYPCSTSPENDYTQWIMQQKITNLQPLDGFIQITTAEPDMITFDDDPNSKRAKMPCGHVIGPESMTEYCTGILNEGKHLFSCPDPGCNAEWQYFLVRHVACLTPSQMQEFEKKISENYIKREEEGVQRCPGCDIYCNRKDKANNCVECLYCSRKHGAKYLFCWKCLGKWNLGNGNTCGNTRCHGIDNRITILASCPNKLILNKFDAPSVRGCPKCGLLIEYLKFCTQMPCKGCGHFFCFLCLAGAKTKKELKCDPYNSTCKIAPRQRELPGM